MLAIASSCSFAIHSAVRVFPPMPLSEQDADASGDILNDSGFFSSTSESWAPPPQPRSTQVRNHEFPGLQRTRALRRALEQSGDTHERVLRVLQKMEDEGLNLTVFLIER